MTTLAELETLRAQAIADPRREAAYLRALLDATLYAHMPMSDDSGKTHFLMFTRPDGLTVIPVFTELGQAEAAARNAARVATLRGADLLEATRGATLMLDPNAVGMTLYPEEIAALLDDGCAAAAPVMLDGPGLELLPPEALDAWLLDVLERALVPVEAVRRFHLAPARPSGSVGAPDRLLVVVATPPAAAERAARAIAVALEGAAGVPRLPIDLTSYGPDETLAPELAKGLQQGWMRELRRAMSGLPPAGGQH